MACLCAGGSGSQGGHRGPTYGEQWEKAKNISKREQERDVRAREGMCESNGRGAIEEGGVKKKDARETGR